MSPSANDNPLEDERGDEDDVLSQHHQQDIVIILSDSEDDDEDIAVAGHEDPSHMGYVLLPQEPTDHVEQQQQASRLTTAVDGPDDDQLGNKETESTSNKNASFESAAATVAVANDIDMDQDRIEKIKAAMAGFALPTSSFPAWANVVPEDQWKDRLINRLLSTQKHSTNQPPIDSSAATKDDN